MDFWKKNGKFLFVILLGFLMLTQQIFVRYRISRSNQVELDQRASYAIDQLEKLWQRADVGNILTPEMLANTKGLEEAKSRLKQTEKAIDESEKQLPAATGKRQELYQKVYAYYRHSASLLISIVDFLISKRGEYSVKENQIDFDSEKDAEHFRTLIEQLSPLYQEKIELDAFIRKHNEEFTLPI